MDEARQKELRDELLRRELAKRQQQAEPEAEPNILQKALSRVQDFSEGIGVSGLETYYGLKDLVGKGSPEDRATLDAWRQAAGESGFGTAGKLTGDIAQYALPGTMIGRAATVPGLLADVTATTAIDVTKLPEAGESRIDRAKQGAMFGMGGHVLGKTLGVAATGVRGTPAAERLRDIGGKLTPGQLKEGIFRKAEHWGEAAVPFVSKAVREAEKKSGASISVALMNKAAPPTPQSLMTGNPVKAKVNSMEELNQAFDDAYEVAWGKVDDLDMKGLGASTGDAIRNVVVKKDRKAMMNIVDQMEDILRKQGASANEVDALLRKHMRPHKGGKNHVWNEAINNIRAGLTSAMPEANRDAIRLVNSTYGDRMALGYGAQSLKGVKGKGLDPSSLASGVKRSSDARALEEGRGNLQQELRDWTEVVGEPAGVIPLLKRRVIQGVPEPGVLGAASDLVAGNYGYQAAARKFRDSPKGRVLRLALSPYRTSAAVGPEMIEEEEEY